MSAFILSLLAAAAGQPVITRPVSPPTIVIQTPPPIGDLAPLPDGPRPVTRASANLPALFSTDDYPTAARRAGQEGTTHFTVAINRDGRVTGCRIDKSSGSASLDVTTCSIIQRRARFNPARDAAGGAVEDRYEGRIRWVLPPRQPLPVFDYKGAILFTIDAQGMIAGCTVEGSAPLLPPASACAPSQGMATRFVADEGSNIELKGRELLFEQGFVLGGPDAARNVGRKAGEQRAKFFALALTIDAAGRATGCETAVDSLEPERTAAACELLRLQAFAPLDNAAALAQPERRAVRYWTVYTRPAR